MSMNLGDIYDHVDKTLNPDFVLIYEEGPEGLLRSVSAESFRKQTNNLARALLEAGCHPGDKVAIYMRNRIEYLIATIALLKARLVHVNVNFRYKADELKYLLDNSDSKCVIFESRFAERLDAIRTDLATTDLFVQVSDEDSCDSWAQDYQNMVRSGDGVPLDVERSSDDMFFLYTGGTTGMPKGVMWNQAVLWKMIGGNPSNPTAPAPRSLQELPLKPEGGSGATLALLPFMHGAGVWSSLTALAYGDPVVVVRSERFDPELMLSTIDKYSITQLTIAGDAFARPMVDALVAAPAQYRLDSLLVLRSSAMVFSSRNKSAFIRHCPNLTIVDVVGSSESCATAASIANKDTDFSDPRGLPMYLLPAATVFDEDWNKVEPKAGNRGVLAVTGTIPVGYYKAEQKTAETMPIVDGVRYSRPGDWVEFQEDGSVIFLGRGNVCINTGGEKVYPEEVEIVLRSHPDVADCLIVGVPDDKFGEAITAVIQLQPGAAGVEDEFKQHIRNKLADYKTPRHVVFVPEVFRSAAGKADYKMTRDHAVNVLS